MHFLCTQWHLRPRLCNRGLLLVEMALSEVSLARKNKNKREQNACHKKQHVGPLLLVPPPCPSAAFCKSSTASCRDRREREKTHTQQRSLSKGQNIYKSDDPTQNQMPRWKLNNVHELAGFERGGLLNLSNSTPAWTEPQQAEILLWWRHN